MPNSCLEVRGGTCAGPVGTGRWGPGDGGQGDGASRVGARDLQVWRSEGATLAASLATMGQACGHPPSPPITPHVSRSSPSSPSSPPSCSRAPRQRRIRTPRSGSPSTRRRRSARGRRWTASCGTTWTRACSASRTPRAHSELAQRRPLRALRGAERIMDPVLRDAVSLEDGALRPTRCESEAKPLLPEAEVRQGQPAADRGHRGEGQEGADPHCGRIRILRQGLRGDRGPVDAWAGYIGEAVSRRRPTTARRRTSAGWRRAIALVAIREDLGVKDAPTSRAFRACRWRPSASGAAAASPAVLEGGGEAAPAGLKSTGGGDREAELRGVQNRQGHPRPNYYLDEHRQIWPAVVLQGKGSTASSRESQTARP